MNARKEGSCRNIREGGSERQREGEEEEEEAKAKDIVEESVFEGSVL